MSCCEKGPGYASPAEAIKGPRETLLYVTCVQVDGEVSGKPDYLAVVDVDPKSADYCKVIGRCFAETVGDEFHHTGWNACSSCYGNPGVKRNQLIVPCLKSNRIYILDTSNAVQPEVVKVIDNLAKFKVSAPHTSHCLADGQIMISCMGDENGDSKGRFILLGGKTFEVTGHWGDQSTGFGYDFWYQPEHDVMVSTEWGDPKAWKSGFKPEDVAEGKYGSSVHIWQWSSKKLSKSIDLGQDGLIPLEVRFLHNPARSEAFVGCTLSSSVFRIYKKDGDFLAEKVIQVEPIPVKGWSLPSMPGITTFIIISMDDKYLFLSNWIQGDIRQYDITDAHAPKLVGQLFLGGSMCRDGDVEVIGKAKDELVEKPVVKGVPLRGGPQMLQLSLDGKRLYVTNSLFSAWDKQFYPEIVQNGGHMVMVHVDIIRGGLKLDHDFLVDFACEPHGPVLAHEMRYPGGDCTSDIFL
ncbi:Methanethiol oxidase [Halotydeus destructor]|nr:Methanethiol oxidase [Halotydeus destructor]